MDTTQEINIATHRSIAASEKEERSVGLRFGPRSPPFPVLGTAKGEINHSIYTHTQT